MIDDWGRQLFHLWNVSATKPSKAKSSPSAKPEDLLRNNSDVGNDKSTLMEPNMPSKAQRSGQSAAHPHVTDRINTELKRRQKTGALENLFSTIGPCKTSVFMKGSVGSSRRSTVARSPVHGYPGRKKSGVPVHAPADPRTSCHSRVPSIVTPLRYRLRRSWSIYDRRSRMKLTARSDSGRSLRLVIRDSARPGRRHADRLRASTTRPTPPDVLDK